MTAIEYRSVCKQFPGGSAYAVNGVSAAIEEGEFITILGSSGCGKTTLLKMTNRLYEPAAKSACLGKTSPKRTRWSCAGAWAMSFSRWDSSPI